MSAASINEDLITALQQHLFTTQEDILQLREAFKRLDSAIYAARQKVRRGPKGSTSVLAPKPREPESELREQIAELETELSVESKPLVDEKVILKEVEGYRSKLRLIEAHNRLRDEITDMMDKKARVAAVLKLKEQGVIELRNGLKKVQLAEV